MGWLLAAAAIGLGGDTWLGLLGLLWLVADVLLFDWPHKEKSRD